MVSAVRSRPNHYEVLGLTPTASADEIAQAFAREVSVYRPRAFGGVAEVSIAYETLRDPTKRRAYDASIGIAPKLKAVPAPSPRQEVERNPPVEGETERTLGSFIAASLRQPTELPAKPGSKPQQERRRQTEAGPSPQRERQAEAEPSLDARIPDFLAVPRQPGEWRIQPLEDRPMQSKRVGLAAGGLVLVVGLLGILAMVSGRDDTEAPPLARADVTVPLPAAKPVEKTAVLSPAADTVEPPPEPAIPAGIEAPQAEPNPAPEQAAPVEERPAEGSRSADTGTAENVAERTAQPAVESAPAQAVAAGLPLSNSTIARTIERIGYACGEVASTTAAGAPGVYKVTCTSGQSYQATPVNGRYRFRRWGSR